MYPILFELGSIRIGSYGTLLALGFLAAIMLVNREFRFAHKDLSLAWDIYLLAMLGGMIGSKTLYILEHWSFFLREPARVVLSPTGFSVFGGFLLAFALCYIRVRMAQEPFLGTADLVAPGMAVGYAVGRLGCITAGDGCYGIPTQGPLGMTFPNGIFPTLASVNHELVQRWLQLFPGQPVPADIPVHPTPLYESISIFCLVALLLAYRHPRRPGLRLGAFLLWFGLSRFVVEFIRLNPIWALGLTSDQWLAMAFFGTGLLLFLAAPAAPVTPAAPAVPVAPDIPTTESPPPA